MAASPGHKLGQIIGDAVEAAVSLPLSRFASAHGLFLDTKGPRPPIRTSELLVWEDHLGNDHRLDFVLERDGALDRQGRPAAFVEVAWRRYAKHSKNKAQEIQGALGPLVAKYRDDGPCQAVVLAGVFTGNSVAQLRSHGFVVLHFPYEKVVESFEAHGLDVRFDEETPDEAMRAMVAACEDEPELVRQVGAHLFDANADLVGLFVRELETKVLRSVSSVVVISLFGETAEFADVPAAILGIAMLSTVVGSQTRRGFEVVVKYENGDEIDAKLADIEGVRGFLQRFVAR